MAAVTVEGVLGVGVEDDKGVFHTKFEMAAPTIRMEIDAMDKLTQDGEAAETGTTFSLYLAAEQLLSLGTLKPDDIDADMLMGLDQDDMIPLFAKQVEVKKKRLDMKKESKATKKST